MQPRRKPPILAGLNVGLVNACSAVHKAAEIHALIAEHHLDVLHVTETSFLPDAPDTISMDIAPPGFRLLSAVSSNGRRGGGLAVIFKEHLKVSTAKLPLSPSSFEMQAINLIVGNINFTLLGIYRPPSTNTDTFLEKLSDVLDAVNLTDRHSIILGDVNCPGSKPDDIDHRLSALLIYYGLAIMNPEPLTFTQTEVRASWT